MIYIRIINYSIINYIFVLRCLLCIYCKVAGETFRFSKLTKRRKEKLDKTILKLIKRVSKNLSKDETYKITN